MPATRTSSVSYFNPRSPHGERRDTLLADADVEEISIHAPRTGSDPAQSRAGCRALHFNPRSPHGERLRSRQRRRRRRHFNPRSPHGERRPAMPRLSRRRRISIHAPRTGSDAPFTGQTRFWENFNPRSPHGERREIPRTCGWWPAISIHAPRTGSDDLARTPWEDEDISIHAPRTGSDSPSAGKSGRLIYFNPRSPHGERPGIAGEQNREADFNPRSPHGERRLGANLQQPHIAISIHAPRTGSDRPAVVLMLGCVKFQSTLPARGATGRRAQNGRRHAISIHAPRTGSDAQHGIA